jgi:predicted metalloprotease
MRKVLASAAFLVLFGAACGGGGGESADAAEDEAPAVEEELDDEYEEASDEYLEDDEYEDAYDEEYAEDEYLEEEVVEEDLFAATVIDDETLADLQMHADDAVAIFDEFWATHWSEFFDGEYESPAVLGGYSGAVAFPCGDEAADAEDMSDNAYYCFPDDYIAWDWGLFSERYLDEVIGDSVVYLIMAHEWGHAIQGRMNEEAVSVTDELQADCFAGASIAGAIADGIFVEDSGDRGEVFQALASFADEVEWGDVEDHGSADERIEAYQLGEAEGLAGCLAME